MQDVAAAFAAALDAPLQRSGAAWRWGTVTANNRDGTLDVSVGGATLEGVTACAECRTASAGDRVRVAYLGTDAVADALLADLPAGGSDEYPLATLGGTGTNQFYAHNSTATLMSSGTTPSAQWGSDAVCTIPAGYRPKMALYYPVQKDGATVSDTYLIVNTDGTVTIQNAGGTQAARGYRVTATWAY